MRNFIENEIFMKNLIAISLLGMLIGFSSCEKEKNVKAIYIVDCSGDYLLVNDSYYLICNYKMFAGVENGTAVTASFSFVDACTIIKPNSEFCLPAYSADAWIEVRNMYQ